MNSGFDCQNNTNNFLWYPFNYAPFEISQIFWRQIIATMYWRSTENTLLWFQPFFSEFKFLCFYCRLQNHSKFRLSDEKPPVLLISEVYIRWSAGRIFPGQRSESEVKILAKTVTVIQMELQSLYTDLQWRPFNEMGRQRWITRWWHYTLQPWMVWHHQLVYIELGFICQLSLFFM